MNNNTFPMLDNEYAAQFYDQEHQAQPSTIQPLVLNLDFSQISSPTSSFQQLDSSSPGWSSATSVVGSPCGPLAYGEYDIGLGDTKAITDDRSYYGPGVYNYDCHADPSWVSSSPSASFWMDEPPQILKSNDGCGQTLDQRALQYGPLMPQPSIGVLGLPSGQLSSTPGWAIDHKVHHDVKASPSRKPKPVKTKRVTLRNARQCDAIYQPKGEFICELSKDGTACGKKFARKEHRKRHWDSGCKIFPSTKKAPQCVIGLYCAESAKLPCKKLNGTRLDNMRQHIATHLKGGRNESVDADFLYYCLVRHDEETGVRNSKAAAAMESAIRALTKADNAKSCRVDPSLMEQHAWYSDFLRERESTHPERRSNYTARLEQIYRAKAWPGAMMCGSGRKRTSKL